MEFHHKYFELKSICLSDRFIFKIFEMAIELNLFTKLMYGPIFAELMKWLHSIQTKDVFSLNIQQLQTKNIKGMKLNTT